MVSVIESFHHGSFLMMCWRTPLFLIYNLLTPSVEKNQTEYFIWGEYSHFQFKIYRPESFKRFKFCSKNLMIALKKSDLVHGWKFGSKLTSTGTRNTLEIMTPGFNCYCAKQCLHLKIYTALHARFVGEQSLDLTKLLSLKLVTKNSFTFRHG